jgi:hypothetical protein
MYNEDRPLIIGGTGGSGTRLFARVCMLSGFYLGANLNPSLDSLDFYNLYERWINKYLLKKHVPLRGNQEYQMDEDLKKCTFTHRASVPKCNRRWGFKNPRSMYLLPFFNRRFPKMRFIHVLRDGRDMAYSRNQKQVYKHGQALLREQYQQLNKLSLPIAFWRKSNLEVAGYGEHVMRDRYIRVRFEDMCTRPEATIIRLLNFLEVKFEDISIFIKEIKPPESIGRWLSRPIDEQIELTIFGHSALKYFGYI